MLGNQRPVKQEGRASSKIKTYQNNKQGELNYSNHWAHNNQHFKEKFEFNMHSHTKLLHEEALFIDCHSPLTSVTWCEV